MVIMKFGGSSVGSAEAIAQVADIVSRYAADRPVIVVSALKGVTDALIALAEHAVRGCPKERIAAACEELRKRHEDVIDGVTEGAVAAEVVRETADLIGELGSALAGIACLRELSPRSSDLVVSFGERMSAPIVSAALRARGMRSVPVDARMCIVTDDHFTSAEVDLGATAEKARQVIAPLVAEGSVPVVTGFVAATPEGFTTTLGRGGSDYTATILGGALGADEVWIWKEVDGVLTADPRSVPDAALISGITYDEAAEMSYFGAKVLHPKTMVPAAAAGIPIRIRNTFDPSVEGTRIGPDAPPAPKGVKVVTAIKGLSMVTVEGKGMLGITGLAAHVFAVAGRERINVLMFTQSSSEQNICLIVTSAHGAAFRRALEEGLKDDVHARRIDRIAVEDGVAAVAVVGEGMRGAPGIAAGVFAAVASAGVNVLAIAQGSSERNISFIVREDAADGAVRAVHRAFSLDMISQPVCVR